MPKPSLHAQISSVDVAATIARRRGPVGMKPKEWEHIDPGLGAAYLTLLAIQNWRARLMVLAPEFIREIEGP